MPVVRRLQKTEEAIAGASAIIAVTAIVRNVVVSRRATVRAKAQKADVQDARSGNGSFR